MKLLSACIIALLCMSVKTFSQQTVTEIIMPRYVQGAGTFSTADDKKTPFVCRLKISGLNAGATYRYAPQFVSSSGATSANGNMIKVNATGDFTRVVSPSVSSSGKYGEFTTDAAGTYTGWFMSEVTAASSFVPGSIVYFRITLNNGNNGLAPTYRLTTTSPITVINFGNKSTDGTAIRSTPASLGLAKNFVLLWDEVPGRPVAGTVIESDGTDNSVANGYADFYANAVNGADKTWGTIIPNNLSGGIRKIVQYSLANATETGSKTSSNGSWAKDGGGSVSTVNASGGLTNVIVLNGTIITLGPPVLLSQTITFNTLPAKTYGNIDFDAAAASSAGLPIVYTSSDPAVATIINGMIHITGAGTTTITAAQPGNDDYSAATPATQILTIHKATLTAKADDVTRLKDDPNPVFTISYSGFVNGEDITVITTPATATTTATTSSPGGTYPITPAGAVAANYQFTYAAGLLTVNAVRQPQSIAFPTLPVTLYGAADFTTDAAASSHLALDYTSSNTAVAIIDSKGLIHITGAGSTTITVSQTGNNAFLPATPVSEVLTVNQAPLLITAENKTRLLGQPNPALTVLYSGFVNGENSTVFTTPPVIATTATTSAPAGDYPITVSGAVAANYTITYINALLTVQPLPAQTISFNTLATKHYGDANFAPGATASSGLTVTYTSSNAQVATIVNGMIHVIGGGTTDITASQAGDPFHAAAPSVTRPLSVQKATLLIRAADTSKNEGQPNPSFLIKYTGFVNGENAGNLAVQPTVSTIATTSSLTGNYPITVSGASSPNYTIAQLAGTLRILPTNGKDQNEVNAYISAPGKLRMNYYATAAEKVQVQLSDSYGNRILNTELSAAKGLNTWSFDVNNLAAGIYPIRIISQKTAVKTKVIIR